MVTVTEAVIAPTGTEATASPAPADTSVPQPLDLDTVDPQARDKAIEDWMAKKSHEELSKHPGYNKAVQRKLSKLEQDQRVRLQQEQQAQAQRSLQYQQHDNYFRGLDGPQLYEALQNPQTKAAFDEVQQWKRSGTGQTFDEKSYLGNAVKRFKDILSEKDEFTDAPWDEVESKTDLGEALVTLAEHATGKQRKQMETDFNKLRAQLKTEIMAEMANTSDQPDQSTGGVLSSGNPNRVLGAAFDRGGRITDAKKSYDELQKLLKS